MVAAFKVCARFIAVELRVAWRLIKALQGTPQDQYTTGSGKGRAKV